MSEMVEHAAKAMWDDRRARAADVGIFLEFWGDGTVPKANGIMEEARAAIEAMRDPTEGMIYAGATCPGDGNLDVAARMTWEAMIDEALK